jgi:phosphate transport system substrate-binding protein
MRKNSVRAFSLLPVFDLLFPMSFLLFPLLLVGCVYQPITVTREPITLRLVAADSCGPLAEKLVIAYQEVRPWVTVDVEVFNASVAERALRAGEADLALLPWLQEAAGERALWAYPFARDGVAIIVHPATPFGETGLAHLREMFRGRVQEWGGMVLTVVSREEGSGTREAFESAVMGGLDVALTSVRAASAEAVIEYVAGTPGAIGYVSTWRIDVSVTGRVRVLPVEGIPPSPANIADGSYPLSRSVYLATVAEPTGEAREFAQWLLGPGGQAITGRLGEEMQQ